MVDLNYNFECDLFIELPNNKLSDNKLFDNKLSDNKVSENKLSDNKLSNINLPSESVKNTEEFFKPITIEEVVIFLTNRIINE